MLVLAFDTSTPAVTVAVASIDPWDLPAGGWLKSTSEGVTVLASETQVVTNRHGELLAPLIGAALGAAGALASDLGAIGIGLGPGPFTGLRVGIVTAKAMADALGIPAYGASSLQLISTGRAGIATNARRKQVYWAVPGGRGFVAGPDIASPTAAAAAFEAAGLSRVAGEGPVLYPEAFAGFTALSDRVYPRAELLVARIANRVRAEAPGEELTPLYLRRPDAQPPGRPKQVTPA
ncbi:MAG TPA: tRNA (adenosine(37)-N6)-threonylcarbamoyltransferase complex dimerization subunit type 1 TsaB [Mycobacteriales bacterium]|nr:tRNA (adenosine(37)-N6)-threonylcarbamoyltransferase complex dimerization subunit type 1 TsaB [Mycobacteriales bacterium]